jgi:hypothetical protein
MQRGGLAGGRDRLHQEMPVGDEGLAIGLLGPGHDVGVHRRVGAVGGEVGRQQGPEALGALIRKGRTGEEKEDDEEAHGRGSGW